MQVTVLEDRILAIFFDNKGVLAYAFEKSGQGLMAQAGQLEFRDRSGLRAESEKKLLEATIQAYETGIIGPGFRWISSSCVLPEGTRRAIDEALGER